MAAPATTEPYTALILAGGEGSRMGGLDKGLQPWRGQALYRHVLARLHAQIEIPAYILISANRHLSDYAETGYLVLPDQRAGHCGPLAGIESGLLASTTDWLLCVACDMPQLPSNLAQALFLAAANGHASYAVTQAGPQPICCLLHRQLLPSLQAALHAGQGGVRRWLDGLGAGQAFFDDIDAFSNYNTLAALNDTPPTP